MGSRLVLIHARSGPPASLPDKQKKAQSSPSMPPTSQQGAPAPAEGSKRKKSSAPASSPRNGSGQQSSQYGNSFSMASGIAPGLLSLDADRYMRDPNRSVSSSSGSAATPKKPMPSPPVPSSAQQSTLKTPRSASIFRMGRRSFGKRKQTSKDGRNSGDTASSIESQRSTEIIADEARRRSESASPTLVRDGLTSSLPRQSMASSRGADSNSDVDGGRASSDLDSMVGHGRSGLGLNQSSGSLVGDPIAEVGEGVEEANLVALVASRKASQEVPDSSSSGSSTRARLGEAQKTPVSPQSPWSLRKGVTPPSIGQAPAMPLPPLPKSAPNGSTFEDQRASLNKPLVPSSRGSSGTLRGRPNATSRMASKIKSRWENNGMNDDEVPPTEFKGLGEALGDNHLPRSSGEEGLEEFLRKSSPHEALVLPPADNRQVRKSRSQSSFKLARKSSFFGAPKPSVAPESTVIEQQQQQAGTTPRMSSQGNTKMPGRKARPRTSGGESNSRAALSSPAATTAKRSPWDVLTASRLDMTDSSPEQERSQPFFTESQQARRNSASLVDKRSSNTAAVPERSRFPKGYASASTSRPASPPAGSRLDSSGGAANLFGASTSTPRQRTSSLLPSMPWRPRTSSNAANDSVPSQLNKQVQGQGVPIAPVSAPAGKDKPAKEVDAGSFEGNAEAFVQWAITHVARTEVAAILASSGDVAHRDALNIYMRRFFFAGNPLDIALRKLLMSLCLPKETQQIDRVMEAFAQRYNECNERLFLTDDQPYVLAFSLMMLHTDAFNKNARQKMSKQDYLRNTASCGVQTEILEYLYDNLTFTQFIYVDDDEVLSRRKSEGESGSSFLSAFSSTSNTVAKNRIDPYYIIASGQTHTLRPDIASIITEDTPFAAKGTLPTYDVEALNRVFNYAPSIEIATARRPSVPGPAAVLGSDSLSTTFGAQEKEAESVVTLRVTKVGCVSRKDDIVDEDKKAQSRKWRTCGMLLSSSQLLFFKDLVWTGALDLQIREQTQGVPEQEGGVLITPRITYFRPDGVLALGDAIAVKDTTYTKYEHVFRLIARQGEQSRQYLIQTGSEAELNDWVHKINFCAAFRAAGVRIRGLDPPPTPSLESDSPRSVSFSTFRSDGVGDISTDMPYSSPPLSPSSANSEGTTNVALIGLMRRRVNTRRKEVLPKLEAVSAELEKRQTELNDKLRFARHLGILTPFMKATRERIEMTAIPLSHSIRRLRLEVARYRSRQEILQLELEAGDRAARSIAPATSFFDSKQSGWSASRVDSTSTLPMLPAPALDVAPSQPSQNGQANEAGAGMATPTMRMIPVEESEAAAARRMRKTLSGSISPALIINAEVDSSAPPSLSPITPPLLSLDRFGHVLDVKSPSSPEDTLLATPASSTSSTGKFPPSPLTSVLPREEAERWDRSRVVRDSKRVSLVTLPDPEHLKDLSRMSIHSPTRLHGHKEGE